jgi:hypothetical protein
LHLCKPDKDRGAKESTEYKDKSEFNPDLSRYDVPETNVQTPADQPFVLFKRYIRRFEKAAIVAQGAGGKTFLSTILASDEKVLFLAVDDINGEQKNRYSGVRNNAKVMSGFDWDELVSGLQESVQNKCWANSLIHSAVSFLLNTSVAEAIKQYEKLTKECGNKNTKLVNSLYAFELLMNSPALKEYKIVVLDSLIQFLGSDKKITAENLKRIIRAFKDSGKTLVILHHENKTGGFSGNHAFRDVLDTLLFLIKGPGDLCFIIEDKARYKKSDEIVNSVFELRSTGHETVEIVLRDDLQYLVRDGNNPCKLILKNRILLAIGTMDTISLDELCASPLLAKYNNKHSIENALADLENEVEMADGKSWAVIRRKR